MTGRGQTFFDSVGMSEDYLNLFQEGKQHLINEYYCRFLQLTVTHMRGR